MTKKLFLLAVLLTVSTGFCGVLTPVPGAPELRKLNWQNDEFSRREVREGKTFFVVEVPRGSEKGMHGFTSALDVTKLRGKRLSFMVRYKVTGVSAPPKPYLGSKFMLSYQSAPGAGKLWPDANLPEGDSEWQSAVFNVEFTENATGGELVLGMQDVSGKIEFELDSLECGVVFSPENRVNLDYVVTYPERIAKHRRQRGVMAPGGPITETMLRDLKAWNANLVRAQIIRNWGKINTELDLEEYFQWLDKRLGEIERSAKIAEKYDIKFVIDLHSPPGGKIDSHNMRMFFEPKYADAFLDCWRKIATRFRGNQSIYAYNLVNEPVQSVPSECDYWELQRRAAEVVRAIDPDTPVMFESNESDRPQTFTYLSPIRMDNVIYKVHMYFPLSYTHQRLRGEGPVIPYPGMIEGAMWNRERIRKTLAPVREFQLRHKCKIYVGEFSAIVWAPGAGQYIRDCISIFEEYGWDWTFHAFREWSGWSVEHDGTGPADLKPAENTPRKQALLEGLRLNRM